MIEDNQGVSSVVPRETGGRMMDLQTPEFLRSVERLIVVVGGVLAIYLGYRLFSHAHLRNDGSGKLKTTVFEFAVAKVGPGVFFALFGTWVLFSSLKSQIQTETSRLSTPSDVT